MLRLYVLQNLYTLSDEGTVAEAIDSRAFSDFCGVDSSSQVPDGDTLGRFRNLLIRNGIQEKLFAQVTELLSSIFHHPHPFYSLKCEKVCLLGRLFRQAGQQGIFPAGIVLGRSKTGKFLAFHYSYGINSVVVMELGHDRIP